MSDIFYFIILISLIIIIVLFNAFLTVFINMVKAGSSTSKLSVDIFKRKDTLAKTPEPSSDKVELNDTIKRWRMVAGILFATVMLFLFIFYCAFRYPSSMVDFFPWSYYVFFPVLLITIIAFIILNKKEQEAKRK